MRLLLPLLLIILIIVTSACSVATPKAILDEESLELFSIDSVQIIQESYNDCSGLPSNQGLEIIQRFGDYTGFKKYNQPACNLHQSERRNRILVRPMLFVAVDDTDVRFGLYVVCDGLYYSKEKIRVVHINSREGIFSLLDDSYGGEVKIWAHRINMRDVELKNEIQGLLVEGVESKHCKQ